MSHPFLRLTIALVVSFGVMLTLSLSMVNAWGDFLYNLSNAWMALMMVSGMGIVMVLVMWGMFPGLARKLVLLGVFAVLLVGSVLLGRGQALVGDEAFLYSMIPHHSRAILVCENSQISDPEIEDLCDQIIESQQQEIDQMKRILERY